jgi:signal transduction histidine kinase
VEPPDTEARDGAKAAELAAWQALEARQTRDRLLNDAGIGTWVYDPDADVFHFSPELTRGERQPSSGVPRAYVDGLVHPDDLAIERPIRDRITREGGVGEMELRMRDPANGDWRHMRILLRAGRQLPSGFYEMYGLTQAVTELAAARDDARASAEQLRLALTAAKAGAFEIDFRARELSCSTAFVELVGRAVLFDEFMARGLGVLHPDNPNIADWIAGERPDGLDYETVDVRVARPGGDRWMRICAEIKRDDERRPLRAIGLMFDIDEAKRQELALVEAQKTAEQATAAKSAFLASVSHEIRTPMNGIVGVLHLLKNERLTADGRGLLSEALACSDMLAQLIDDVLDFSKIEAGKLELTPEPTDVTSALAGVVGLLKPQAEADGLYLRTQIEPGLGAVLVDPVRLRQCLFNLIGNAVKFTKAGGVEVRMRRAGPDRLRIEVEDTGIGIPEAAQARLFDRFEQGDVSTTRRFRGTGLGLSIARSLARLMGGDVGFTSEAEKGSTFWLEVAAPPAAARAAPAPEPADAEPVGLEDLRVLVVDDNPTNRLVATKIMESLGAQAAACADGTSAIAALEVGRFDIVLMDVNMPDMDGMEATRRVRAIDGPSAGTPIVALTADVLPHQRAAYLAAGMNGMVAKPFSPTSLLEEIARVLVGPDADQAGIMTGIAS